VAIEQECLIPLPIELGEEIRFRGIGDDPFRLKPVIGKGGIDRIDGSRRLSGRILRIDLDQLKRRLDDFFCPINRVESHVCNPSTKASTSLVVFTA
jgi:hypothetical protein